MSAESVRAWFVAYDAGTDDVDVGVEEFRDLLKERDRYHKALDEITDAEDGDLGRDPLWAKAVALEALQPSDA